MSRSTRALAALVLISLFLATPASAAQGLHMDQNGRTGLWRNSFGLAAAGGGGGGGGAPPITIVAAQRGANFASGANDRIYIVRHGDSLWRIARRYRTTVRAIKDYNRLPSDLIRPGQLLRLPPPQQRLADEDFYWLVRVISAEARGESLLGQIAVGAVVLNRLKNEQFPNTAKEVIFQPGQFSVVDDGSIYQTPVPSAYTAARLALRGCDPTNGSLYFYNPRIVSRSNWIRSRVVIKAIGRHLFAS